MSTDPSAAMGRIDAAVAESSQPSGVPPRELADLAAAIERIESLIADGSGQGPDGAAAERISDIAFTLHEREVETSLCDTLDAAVREINDVGALKDGSTERKQQAAELLQQLSRRVHDLIAQSQASQRSEPTVGVNAARASTRARQPLLDEGDGEDEPTDNGSFKTDVPEDDEFALVVAALTASLPSLAEFGAPVPVPPAALAQDAPPLPDSTFLHELSVETTDERKATESDRAQPEPSEGTVVVIESSSAVLLDEPVLPQAPSSEGASGKDLAAGEPLALGEDFLRDLMPSDQPAAEPPANAVSSTDAPTEDSAPNAVLALPAPKAPTESTNEASSESSGDLVDHDSEEQNFAAVVDPTPTNDGSSVTSSPLVAPDDDPGDLFESMIPALNLALKPEHIGAETAEKVSEPEQAVEAALSAAPLEPEPLAPPPMPPPQSRATAAAPPQPVPRPASNDPLGPVRALSEEEMIALFS